MTEVNLLPPELRRRHKSRNVTQQVIVGFAGLIVLLLVVYFFEGTKLSSAQSDLAAQQAKNAALVTQISSLQRFADLQAQLTTKKLLVADLEQGEVMWSGVLHDLSMVIPSDVYLKTFDGSITIGPGGWETTAGDTGLIGGMTFVGVSLDYPNVALWIDRMGEVKGWRNAWVSSATKTEDATNGTSSVAFNGTVDLAANAAKNGPTP